MAEIKIKLVKSLIGRTPKQRKVAFALGLRKIGQENTVPENESVKGAIKKIEHLVEVVK